jgi:hypothetical protein
MNAMCFICNSAFGLVYDPSYPPPHKHDRIIRFVCQDCKANVTHDAYEKTWAVYAKGICNFKCKYCGK